MTTAATDRRRHNTFTALDYEKSKAASEATRVATQRLRLIHKDEYEKLVNEERFRRGLTPKKQKSLRRSELERLAQLAIEAGLR